MRTLTIKAYTVNELAPDVKAKVLNKNRYIEIEHDFWSEGLIENWNDKLEALGYNDPKIMFSGFASQGDGACFTATLDFGKWLDRQTALLQKNFRSLQGIASFVLKHRARYYYATSTTVDYELDYNSNLKDEDNLHKLAGIVAGMIEVERATLGNEIYRDLESAYDDLTTDEAVTEALEANEYLFTASGESIVQ